ncbi:PREDICTED: mitogen-activated protein kinase kinase 7-like [Tarenaya hassleriana]|uniref:mitogen-activated protein kinase kinase 7-like n=1 Tax=Tarenaya hassleriana TaxID=28532 RepID=UPI00053C859B|nr:PREDICTED: mitogen-activated protein kinase kinase 7-like [Tarenaya hassleriana]
MDFVKLLGSGSYGSVSLYKFQKRDGTLHYTAVKTSGSREYEELNKEMHILSKLRGCPRIVQCYGDSLQESVTKDGVVYRMHLEYAERGSLRSFVNGHDNGRLSDGMIIQFTRMILEGLVSIHSLGYVHCDLKPENLLVFPTSSSSFEIKIADFGLSRGDGDELPNSIPFAGTPLYMSPESVSDGRIVKALDLWSLGCIVLEMLTGEPPWPEEQDSEDLVDAFLLDQTPQIPATLPSDARKFLETCLARKPEDRGSASSLLAHPFLRSEEEEETKNQNAEEEKAERKLLILKIKRKPKPESQLHNIAKRPLKLKIIPPKPP